MDSPSPRLTKLGKLRQVVHIEVFDYEGEMVLGEQPDPFSYTCQKEYYFGDKKIGETNYNSNNPKRKISLGAKRLQKLKKKANRVLNKAFCYVEGDSGIDVSISGGSSIIYRGNQKQDFMEKVLTMKMR